MTHLQTVTPKELPEVVRVAAALHAQETANAQETQSTVAAATEIGIPPDYLERAAALLAGQRTARRRRTDAARGSSGGPCAAGRRRRCVADSAPCLLAGDVYV